jgi:mono/diheme cytochrome c family protein
MWLRLIPATALAVVLTACGADTPNQATGAAATYQAQCATCHGADRQGVGEVVGLPLERMQELGATDVRLIIAEGGETMAGFADVLSDQEIDDLVAWLLQP